MKSSDWVVQYLTERGVRYVFEVAGGMIAHLLDSLSRQSEIQVVSMHHEQAAAFAAEGVARMTGVPGVALATSGPGATNLLTGIGSMYFDSYPAVFITGQVNRDELKGGRAIRQLGFQELDIVTMARPVTKGARGVASNGELPGDLAWAFDTAIEGRPGPVLLDIPMDVQRLEVDNRPPGAVASGVTRQPPEPGALEAALEALRRAQRPLVLAGGGLRSARVVDSFRQLVDALQVPVAHSLHAVDVLPWGHPLRVGMIGSYGNRWANYAVGRSDCLLVLGSRLDVRQTGSDTAAFRADKTVVHLDCELGEMNNRITGCEAIEADLRSAVPALLDLSRARVCPDRAGWLTEIAGYRDRWPDSRELKDVPGINPNSFMHHLSEASKQAAAWVVDVGQHQMWAAQSVRLGPDQRFLTSGGMGAMGFALPAAIGAALATSGRPIVCVSGDGGFQMNIQELETVSRLGLPVKMVVLDNGALGMVRQFQSDYFESRYQSTLWGYGAPDFCSVAGAYGIEAMELLEEPNTGSALNWLWSDPARPMVLRVRVDPRANAYPKIAYGNPITRMHPAVP